jgi:peroxiredoxin Q/BCP
MLKEGDVAPDFELPNEDGNPVRLSRLKGAPIVLYFYPKDDTSGCTREAKDFSERLAEFAAAGAQVFGVSPDSVTSHDKFRCKHGLTVPLLSDEAKSAASAYEVWKEKSMYGRKYMGVERSTFLIGADGRIVRAWRNVKVPGHVAEVLAAVRGLD